MFKKKQKPIKEQPPWVVTSYSSVHDDGNESEFDTGYIEFEHKQTSRTIWKEMAWLRGDGPYQTQGYKPPTLLDIWNTFKKTTPGTTGFIYKNWNIKRENGCFIYLLVDTARNPPEIIDKGVIGDFVSLRQDFAAFLEMLDNMHRQRVENTKQTVFDIDEAREKREA